MNISFGTLPSLRPRDRVTYLLNDHASSISPNLSSLKGLSQLHTAMNPTLSNRSRKPTFFHPRMSHANFTPLINQSGEAAYLAAVPCKTKHKHILRAVHCLVRGRPEQRIPSCARVA